MSGLDDYGEFSDLAPLLILQKRLEAALGANFDKQLVWVLPSSVLAGVTHAYGIPVIRADVGEPLLAYRSPS